MRHAFGILVIGAVVAIACTASTDPDDGDACHDGDRVQCGCGERLKGLSACVDGRFAECECPPALDPARAPAPVPDPEAGAPDATPEAATPFDAGFGTYLGRCDGPADCPDGGTCFEFGQKGMRCTTTCTASTACAAPSPKCNPKGVCAIPD